MMFLSHSQAIKAETDGLREELEIVQTLGADLIFACGETEKPEVKKTIDEVRGSKDNKTCGECPSSLKFKQNISMLLI